MTVVKISEDGSSPSCKLNEIENKTSAPDMYIKLYSLKKVCCNNYKRSDRNK